MDKRILLIACLVTISGFVVADESADESSSTTKEDPQMENLVDNISDLASKVLEIFEPIAAKANNESGEIPDNTYFVSFLLRDRRNKSQTIDDDMPRQRMIVNNNFSGEKMGTSQVYVESGQSQKQPPAHNVQLLNNPMGPATQQLPQQQFQQPQQQFQQPQYRG